jgi:phosphopantothenoylcysteine decarboxylase/phosphopantothenate--cysteine ligase
MGHALAQAAVDAGANVTLVTTASDLAVPFGADVVHVKTAMEMLQALTTAVEAADIIVMSAAVADFRPKEPQSSKIKKQSEMEGITLELVRNPDIIASISRPGLIKVGFAAETDNLIAYAIEKLAEKGLDMIVANDAESTIGSLESTAHLIFADGNRISLPRLPKEQVAAQIMSHIAKIANARCRG